MVSLQKIRGHRGRMVKSLTGLTIQEIETLLPTFESALDSSSGAWTSVKDSERQRRRGGGESPRLSREDMLLFILVYFKIYPTQDIQALLFGGTQAWANLWVHRLTPVLETSLGKTLSLPTRSMTKTSSLTDLVAQCPELSMIIDVTERPIRRPKDKEKQTSRYSGKQKRHTLKHTVITSATTGRIAYVGPSTDGRVHDKKMADTEEIRLPKGTTLYQDTGYQGFRAPGARRTHQPRKKQRGKERSDEDKAHNRLVSRTRVRVEHAIGGIKRANIIAHTFRNIKLGFDDLTVNVAAGLHNFRVASRSPTANRI